jgi:hypothetical protein
LDDSPSEGAIRYKPPGQVGSLEKPPSEAVAVEARIRKIIKREKAVFIIIPYV